MVRFFLALAALVCVFAAVPASAQRAPPGYYYDQQHYGNGWYQQRPRYPQQPPSWYGCYQRYYAPGGCGQGYYGYYQPHPMPRARLTVRRYYFETFRGRVETYPVYPPSYQPPYYGRRY